MALGLVFFTALLGPLTVVSVVRLVFLCCSTSYSVVSKHSSSPVAVAYRLRIFRYRILVNCVLKRFCVPLIVLAQLLAEMANGSHGLLLCFVAWV